MWSPYAFIAVFAVPRIAGPHAAVYGGDVKRFERQFAARRCRRRWVWDQMWDQSRPTDLIDWQIWIISCLLVPRKGLRLWPTIILILLMFYRHVQHVVTQGRIEAWPPMSVGARNRAVPFEAAFVVLRG
jgi:hypothetical protein